MYGFLLNMWIMYRVDKAKLDMAVVKKYITQDEENMILATPQMTNPMPEQAQV